MRKGRPKQRKILPDPKFNDTLVTRFVNNLMWNGKKSLAFNLFYDALEIVDKRKGDDEKSALEISSVNEYPFCDNVSFNFGSI